MVAILDLQFLTREHAHKLRCFFEAEHEKGVYVWSAGRKYRFLDGEEFAFQHTVLSRERKNDKPGFRYEAIGRLYAEGGCATILEIEGTLSLDDASPQFKKRDQHGQPRLLKLEDLRHDTSEQDIEREFQTGNLAENGSKKPVIIRKIRKFSDGTLCLGQSFMVMRKVGGAELFDILNLRMKRLASTTRLAITQAILDAYEKQIAARHLIHLDISAENIVIDLGADSVKATLIDFGFCHPEGVLRDRPCGKSGYIAPELLGGDVITAAADMYSLGIVLAFVWGMEVPEYGVDLSACTMDKLLKYARRLDLDDLFQYSPDLDKRNRNLIREAIRGMVQPEPEQRFSVQRVRANLAQVVLPPVAAVTPSLRHHSFFAASSTAADQASGLNQAAPGHS